MKKYQQLIGIVFFSFVLSSCGGGNNNNSPVVEPTAKIPSAVDGKIYYDHNCGGCHIAGKDTIAIFDSKDLAQKQDKIKSDMSEYGGFYKLMGRFTNVSQERVNDLKAYFESL